MMKCEAIDYAAEGLNLEGRLIYSESKSDAPLLLVAPNWLGVTPKSIALSEKIAEAGYIVFVADMYGRDARPTGAENPMEFLAPLFKNPDAARSRILAGFDTMVRICRERRLGNAALRAAMGFCFGGANVLDLARSGADVAAVVSMHGNLRTQRPARAGEIKAAVLVAHGAEDPIAPKGDRDAFEIEMTAAKARWTMITFGATYHSFTDPEANRPPVSQFSPFASSYSFQLAHKYIADSFEGRI